MGNQTVIGPGGQNFDDFKRIDESKQTKGENN